MAQARHAAWLTPPARLSGALAVLAVLAGTAGSGCRQSYIPYYDPAPDAWRVSYDEPQAERIQARRERLDRVAANPNDPEAVLALAHSEWSTGRQGQAVEVLDYLLNRINGRNLDSPANATARTLVLQKVRYLSWMTYTPARMAQARKILDGFQPDQQSAAYFLLSGSLYYRQWEYGINAAERTAARLAAVADLDRALATEPGHLDALQLRARMAYEDADWTNLMALCERWSGADPKDGRPWYNRGMALQRLDRYAEALPLFQHAVDLEPYQPDPWYGLAVAHLAAGSREAAQDALERVIQLSPNDADAYFKLYELYSEQPLTPERFGNLVRAATLAKRNLTYQNALVKTIRDEKLNEPALLLFGLKNIMHAEMASGLVIHLEPVQAYAEEAQRQGYWEEAFKALIEPLILGRQFDQPHAELGLRLLQLADHWIDNDTCRWSPPPVELLNPDQPLGAENIGKPVLHKQILDEALYLGFYMLTQPDWSLYSRLRAGEAVPEDGPFARRQSMLDRLNASEQVAARLLVARLSLASSEHLQRVLLWQEMLSPVIPYSISVPGQSRSPWPAWWLESRWQFCKSITAAGSIRLDDGTASSGLLYINDIGSPMAAELKQGLSRDNYTNDQERIRTIRAAWMMIGMLAKMADPLDQGVTPENQASHRERVYLLASLAPMFPTQNISGLEQVMTYAGAVNGAMQELPKLLETEPSAGRRATLIRLYWYWQARTGNIGGMNRAVGAHTAGTAFEATDPYASAARLWLRARLREQTKPASAAGAAVPTVAPGSKAVVAGDLRADLERMLAGLSTWQTVPALKLRMHLSLATGLALNDPGLATAAAENLVRIEASTQQGQETSVLNLLAAQYEQQGRWLPAMYCLRRSLARRSAIEQAQSSGGRDTGSLSGSSSLAEEIRILQWRMIRVLRNADRTEMADDLLYRIAQLGRDLQPTKEAVSGEQSAAKAAALFELAARRMAEDPLKDTFYLCYAAYKMYSADENTEQYRLTYALIALATNAKNIAEPVRVNSRSDLSSPTPYKAYNAQVLLAFDAALHGKPHVLLDNPQLADGYSAYARDALQLALAVHAARSSRAAQDAGALAAEAHLARASHSACPGLARMVPALRTLIRAMEAHQYGEASAAAAREAWLKQGGLPELIDLSTPAAPAAAPVVEPAPAVPAPALPEPAPAPVPAPVPAPAPVPDPAPLPAPVPPATRENTREPEPAPMPPPPNAP